MRLGIGMLLTLALLLGGACKSEDEADQAAGPDATRTSSGVAGSFVGKVEGSDTYVGIVVLETREVLAYACDGTALSRWFRGQAAEDSFSLASGDARLEAKLTTQGANGTLQLWLRSLAQIQRATF